MQRPSLLADAFGSLHGHTELVEPAPVERVRSDGSIVEIEHGRHLVATVRPDAPIQLLLTGHMDTVFAADHPFQDAELARGRHAERPRRRRHEGRDCGHAGGADRSRNERPHFSASAMTC